MKKLSIFKIIFFLILSGIIFLQCKDINNTETNDRLVVNEISPTGGKPGTLVTVMGEGFSLILAENSVLFNGKAGQIQKTTDASIEVIAPEGGSTGKIQVTVRNKKAEGPVFTYLKAEQPQILSISPEVGWDYTLNAVTITGNNFGDNQNKVKVTFDGKDASLQSFSDTQLIVSPPKHVIGKVPVVVKVDSASSNAANYIYQLKPVIKRVYKPGDTTSAYYLGVSNLDQHTAVIKVFVNGNHQAAIDSIYRKGTDEYATEPEGDKIALKKENVDQFVSSFYVDFVVSSNGIKSDSKHFENDPVINDVYLYGNPQSSSVFGTGDTVIIIGRYFNPDTKQAKLELYTHKDQNTKLAPDPKIISWSNQKIKMIMPNYQFNSQNVDEVGLYIRITTNGDSTHTYNYSIYYKKKLKPVIKKIYLDAYADSRSYILAVQNLASSDGNNKLYINDHEVAINAILRKGTEQYNHEPVGNKVVTDLAVPKSIGYVSVMDFVAESNGLKSEAYRYINEPNINDIISNDFERVINPGDTVTISGLYFDPVNQNTVIELWDSEEINHYTPDPEILSENEIYEIKAVIPTTYDISLGEHQLRLKLKINGKEAKAYMRFLVSCPELNEIYTGEYVYPNSNNQPYAFKFFGADSMYFTSSFDRYPGTYTYNCTSKEVKMDFAGHGVIVKAIRESNALSHFTFIKSSGFNFVNARLNTTWNQNLDGTTWVEDVPPDRSPVTFAFLTGNKVGFPDGDNPVDYVRQNGTIRFKIARVEFFGFIEKDTMELTEVDNGTVHIFKKE